MVGLLNFILVLLVFMLGACFGSFFNVVLYRSPKKEKIVNSRSYCPECGKTLRWFELIPVFSYLIQRGRCRKCMSRIKIKYLLMELLCGAANTWAFLTLGFRAETIFALILFPVLISLSAEDIEKTEIPYWCTGTIAVLGIISTVLSLFPDIFFINIPWYEHLIGAVVISLPFAVFCYLGAMGGGDVQLTAAAGLLLGWSIVPAVLIAMLVGGIFGVIIKLIKKQATICFGPFLAVGIATAYLYGNGILQWYSGFFN